MQEVTIPNISSFTTLPEGVYSNVDKETIYIVIINHGICKTFKLMEDAKRFWDAEQMDGAIDLKMYKALVNHTKSDGILLWTWRRHS